MRLLFAHDHRFIPLGNNIFSESQFDSNLWTRYLNHFEKVIVVARQGCLPEHKKQDDLVLSSRENVAFNFIPNLSSIKSQVLKRYEARQLMQTYVSDVDAVIARLPSEIGLLAINTAVKQNKTWAVEVAGCPWDGLWNYGTWQGKFYAPAKYYRVKRAVAKAPYALYVTSEFLQRRYPCKHGQIVNCSNVEIPSPSENILQQRIERIHSSQKKIILGLIGTLRGKFKGIQTVLASLSQIRNDLPHFEFHILGGGSSKKWQELASAYGLSDVVFFDGVLPGGDPVFEWLDNVDIYLQPSFKEGLPRALIEAMSRGCPSIASNVAGIPELLEETNLINPGNVKQLSELLVQSANDRNWMLQQAQRNWQHSVNYSNHILETRRNVFWGEFAEYAASCS